MTCAVIALAVLTVVYVVALWAAFTGRIMSW